MGCDGQASSQGPAAPPLYNSLYSIVMLNYPPPSLPCSIHVFIHFVYISYNRHVHAYRSASCLCNNAVTPVACTMDHCDTHTGECCEILQNGHYNELKREYPRTGRVQGPCYRALVADNTVQ